MRIFVQDQGMRKNNRRQFPNVIFLDLILLHGFQREGEKMKKKLGPVLIIMVFIIFCFYNSAMAESSAKLIQFSLWPSIQLHDPETSIHGFRFNVLYGVNQDVSGLDIGSLNYVSK